MSTTLGCWDWPKCGTIVRNLETFRLPFRVSSVHFFVSRVAQQRGKGNGGAVAEATVALDKKNENKKEHNKGKCELGLPLDKVLDYAE